MTALQAGASRAAEERVEKPAGPGSSGLLRSLTVKVGSALLTLLFVLVFLAPWM